MQRLGSDHAMGVALADICLELATSVQVLAGGCLVPILRPCAQVLDGGVSRCLQVLESFCDGLEVPTETVAQLISAASGTLLCRCVGDCTVCMTEPV